MDGLTITIAVYHPPVCGEDGAGLFPFDEGRLKLYCIHLGSMTCIQGRCSRIAFARWHFSVLLPAGLVGKAAAQRSMALFDMP